MFKIKIGNIKIGLYKKNSFFHTLKWSVFLLEIKLIKIGSVKISLLTTKTFLIMGRKTLNTKKGFLKNWNSLYFDSESQYKE